MSGVSLYIEGQKIDLDDKEGINIKLNTQDINDISKVNAGYSKQFSVMATPFNNKFFKHYYNADIVGGFDARTKKSATIYLDDLFFISGKIRLTSTTLENNLIVSYRIQFEGDVVNVKDLLGDRKLASLDLSEYDHDYTSDNVLLGLQDELKNGSVIYPLISSVNRWLYDSSDTFVNTENTKNIHYKSGEDEQSIFYRELKPAVRVCDIVDKIQEANNINFVGDFFNRDYYKKLYIWFNNDAGFINVLNTDESSKINFDNQVPVYPTGLMNLSTNIFEASRLPEFIEYDDPFGTGGLRTYKFFSAFGIMNIYPQPGFENVKYSYVILTDGVETFREDDISGEYLTNQPILREDLTFYIEASESFSYQVEYVYSSSYSTIGVPGEGFPADTTTGASGRVFSDINSIAGKVVLQNQAPDIKQIDLIIGLIKMFNIALTSQVDGSILWETLPEWYSEGKEYRDFEKYIDLDKTIIKRGKLISEFNFKYQDPQTILALQFKKSNLNAYGDLQSILTEDLDDPDSLVLDGGKLDIELPFENMVYERFRDLDNNNPINLQYGLSVDESLNPVVPKNLIFYRSVTNESRLIGYKKDDGTLQGIAGNYNTPNHSYNLIENTKQSLNWGAEFSTYNNGKMFKSLYAEFYQDYVQDIFNEQRRVYTFDAIIPNFILANIKLNDRLIIGNIRYLINSINSNLTTGKTKLELINDIYEGGELIGNEFYAKPNFINARIEPGTYQSIIYTNKNTTLTLVDEGNGIFASIDGASTINTITTKNFIVEGNPGGNQRVMSILCDNGTETFKIVILQEGSGTDNFDDVNLFWDSNEVTFDKQ